MFATIGLASTFNLHAILPLAYYCCAQHTDEALFNGWVDEDGIHHRLSYGDLKRLFCGKARLQGLWCEREYFILVAQPSTHCTSHASCGSKLSQRRDRFFKKLRSGYPLVDVEAFATALRLCSSCQDDYCKIALSVRAQVWEQMADIFDLEVKWPLTVDEVENW